MTPPHFLSEIAALLVGGAVIAFVCHRLRILPIVSFLLTGAIVGPHALGLVHDEALIEAMAEVGVILLLFTIGIEFSLEKLARIKRIIFFGGGLQVFGTIAAVTGLLALGGVGWRVGVFTGCLVALSSTAIVMKLLMAGRDTSSPEGQSALGILIFQDLAVVAMVLLIPMLGGAGGSGYGVLLALVKAVGVVGVVIVVARRIMPRCLEAVARTCSQEIFLFSVVAICFGTAFLTSLAGVSLSLGAFLAGLVVSESKFSQVAFGEILPLQILFSAAFFLSVGLMFDPSFLVDNVGLVLIAVAGVLVVKVAATGISLSLLGYGAGPALGASVVLAQIGEFSFVLERTGRANGLSPAGLVDGGPDVFIGATVILMVASPFLYRVGHRLRRTHTPTDHAAVSQSDSQPNDEEDSPHDLRDHVIIAGFGVAGRSLADILREQGIPYVVVTLSPDGALEAERGNLRVIRGNYMRQHELTITGLYHARLLVIGDDDFESTLRVVEAAHALNPSVEIVAKARHPHEAAQLEQAGAAEVVVEDTEGVVGLVTKVLEASDLGHGDIVSYATRLRAPAGHDPTSAGKVSTIGDPRRTPVSLSPSQRQAACTHMAQATEVVPKANGCQRCLETGDAWVHLRVCLTCGFVGCCDSSPNRHATKHHQETEHPIVKSLEAGEDWAWCYVDREFL